MVRKALGFMEMGPREATQGELQGELHCYYNDALGSISCT